MVTVICPHCGMELQLEEKYIGQQGRCKCCNQVFTAQPAPEKIPHVASAINQGSGVSASAVKKGCLYSFIIFGIICLLMTIFPNTKKQPVQQRKQHRMSTNSAQKTRDDTKSPANLNKVLSITNTTLASMNIQGSYETEFSEEKLVVTVTLLSPPINAAAYAENICLAVRNKLFSSGAGVKSYRVSLYGPSPGPGLVRVYGAYRFTEGGRGSWKEI